MTTLKYESSIPVSQQKLWDWHDQEAAFSRMVPPWENVRNFETLRGPSGHIDLAVQIGFVWKKWLGSYSGWDEPNFFKDIQIKGPFKYWEHTHQFIAEDESSKLVDQIDYKLPFGKWGERLASKAIKNKLDKQFNWRHKRLRRDLDFHKRFPKRGKVILTGGSGLVGTELRDLMASGGFEVVQLVRSKPKKGQVQWNAKSGEVFGVEQIEGALAWIHLSGDNIAEGRWTITKRRRILESRVRSTQSVVKVINQLEKKPKALVSASAIGYYGTKGEFQEGDACGDDFLAKVCQKWEAATEGLCPEVRLVQPRIGVVVAHRGGVLAKVLPMFKMGIGGAIGRGQRIMSWIDLEDLTRILYQACFDERFVGVFNVVTPYPVSNQEWTMALAKKLRRPSFLAVPPFLLSLFLGEMARATVLSSAKISPNCLKDWGYEYQFENLIDSLENQLGV